MDKPITIARREFIEAMSKIISESGLPFSMLCDIFRDATLQMQQLDNEQYERDKKAYEEFMKEKSMLENVKSRKFLLMKVNYF